MHFWWGCLRYARFFKLEGMGVALKCINQSSIKLNIILMALDKDNEWWLL